MKRFKSAYVLLSLVGVLFLTGAAQAGTFLSMDPGEATIREFLLYKAFDAKKLAPMETFMILGSGDDTTYLGDLTVTVTPAIEKDFGTVIDYSVIGFALQMPLPAEGKIVSSLVEAPQPFVFVMANATAPLKLTKVISLYSKYAFVFLGVFIKNIDGDWNSPGKFSISFAFGSNEGPVVEAPAGN